MLQRGLHLKKVELPLWGLIATITQGLLCHNFRLGHDDTVVKPLYWTEGTVRESFKATSTFARMMVIRQNAQMCIHGTLQL